MRTPGELAQMEIRHDELHFLLAAMVLSGALVEERGRDDLEALAIVTKRMYDGLEDGKAGFNRLLDRLKATHGDMCNPPRDRRAALLEQAQVTFDKDEVMVLVVFESLAAATLMDAAPEYLLRAIAQAHAYASTLGQEGCVRLRSKLHLAMRATNPDITVFDGETDAWPGQGEGDDS